MDNTSINVKQAVTEPVLSRAKTHFITDSTPTDPPLSKTTPTPPPPSVYLPLLSLPAVDETLRFLSSVPGACQVGVMDDRKTRRTVLQCASRHNATTHQRSGETRSPPPALGESGPKRRASGAPTGARAGARAVREVKCNYGLAPLDWLLARRGGGGGPPGPGARKQGVPPQPAGAVPPLAC